MSAPDSVPNFKSGKSRVLHPRVLRLLTLCLTGAVAGTWLGLLSRRWSAARVQAASGLEASAFTETGPETAQGQESSPPASGPPLSAVKAGSAAGKAGADRITTALTADKGVEYWLHLLSAADGSSASVLAALAESLKDEPAALSLIGGCWAQLDPAGMLAALKRQEPLSHTGSAITTPVEDLQKILVSEWFRQDPAALIKALDAIPGADQLRPAKDGLLQLLAVKDPGQTLKLIVNWDLPIRTVPSKVLMPWLQAHPREAMQSVLARQSTVTDWEDGASGTLRGIAEAMASLDPIGALTQPVAFRSALSSTFFDKVMEVWASRDPAAASTWLAGGEVDRLTKNKLSRSLLQTWSQTDPRAAMEWADAHLAGTTRLEANRILIPALVSRDPDGAAEFVSGMAPGFARDEAVMQLSAGLLNDKGKAEALANFQRLAALTDPVLRKAALASAAWPMMRAAPQEFMAWLAGPEGSQAPFSSFHAAADTLAQTDGQAAMNWASGLRPEISGEVRNSVLYRWLETGPEAAKTWLEALPAGSKRQTGITIAAAFLGDNASPAKYAAWLESLPASDHPAIAAGLEKASSLDLKTKTLLLAKYR